ncbi:ATP-dependent DNA helicase [Mucilaginibacter boryungensis]|uniref:AAA family ATPase n=1 Tax=Mucilaginibacter boryungensis TaxID=768480 RepID=A0ABR9XIG9_9SPHI|nr:DEAD/DEAH box helicase [Mucilaginibacter boryungensis]MBE9666990.1 AAA family ATPase [Mucilaginibacter boryungensis]
MSVTITLNKEQTLAFKAIKKFLEHPSADTFVLKGYAGTGKTFLMQHLGKWLEEEKLSFRMLAATGRAASVLRGKTGFDTKTVHSEIYNFSKVEGLESAAVKGNDPANNAQMSMQFLLRIPDEGKILYIVDEASMMSGEQSGRDDHFASFGSGVLLDDLFEVAGKNKIIFVGDPCQLPPVGQKLSPALDMDWLAKKNRTAISFTLQKIERTDAGNDVLKLASAVRAMGSEYSANRFIKIPAAGLNNVKLHQSTQSMFRVYSELYRKTGPNQTLAIARSNKLVQNINKAMRRDLHGSQHIPLKTGDVLLVTQNNYKIPLTNGDFVTVLALGEYKSRMELRFQKVRIKAHASDIEYDTLLSLDALDSEKGTLDTEQQKLLMIDFNNRMNIKDIKSNSAEYKKNWKDDEYLNCIRASYGYGVTCHKSQGGEWNEVFLFLDKSMYGMDVPELCKWWYTAITRAKTQLNLVKDWWVV